MVLLGWEPELPLLVLQTEGQEEPGWRGGDGAGSSKALSELGRGSFFPHMPKAGNVARAVLNPGVCLSVCSTDSLPASHGDPWFRRFRVDRMVP